MSCFLLQIKVETKYIIRIYIKVSRPVKDEL